MTWAEKEMLSDFKKRLKEIKQALKQQDPKLMIIALDNGLNQWHQENKVMTHMACKVSKELPEKEFQELQLMTRQIYNILFELDREPPQESYYWGPE